MRAFAMLGDDLAFTAWRGVSGRRYVTSIYASASPEIAETSEAIVVAVRRDRSGRAEPIGSAAFESDALSAERRSWITEMVACGACEMHVHLLAESPAARRAVLDDLGGRAEV